MLKQSNTLPTKKKVGAKNKLVFGFAALAATAVIGTTGIAAAAQNTPSNTGSGYGGNTANVDLNLNVSGSNNVVNIVLNLFR